MYKIGSLKTILIVDDNEDVRFMLRTVLGAAGLCVQEAVNGEEALHILQTSSPALILLDLMMPKLNGFAVLHLLHRNPCTRDIPVIVLSAIDLEAHGALSLPNVKACVQKATQSVLEIRQIVLNHLAETDQHRITT